ncbi:hypothetical protein CPB86DRAFT_809962 [Serendipita vermifera]|nr:hypothetical protein CPB86DRAFT_809962 [Serendipita vermifera]
MNAPKTPVTYSRDSGDEGDAVDADLILQHKENIQPLASGRRAAALAGSLSTTPKQKESRLMTERRQFEEEAELALDNDDDPLAAWIRFVDWTVDNYPQGVSAESGLLELLERATRIFSSDPRYKNDMRYLKLWIHYASYVDHPVKIFSYLNTNEIGTAYALFYEEYCNALERSGRREEAMEMYDIGIARRAHPLSRLQARKRDFSVRMMSSNLPSNGPSDLSASQHNRHALAERTTSSREGTENRNTNQGSSRAQELGRSGNNRGAFQIYTEGESEAASGNAWNELESRDAHRKENYRSSVPVQGEVLKQSISDAPRTPRIDVYMDDTNEPKTPARSNKDEGVFTLSSKKPGIDTLKKDPLRNHAISSTLPPPEPKAKESRALSDVHQPVTQSSTSGKSSAKSKVSKSLPSVKPNERLQINVSMLVLADGTEIHPLERRARDFGFADKKWPPPDPEQMENGNNRGPGPSNDGYETKVDFDGTKPMTLASTNYTGTMRDATVTINTKEALMAVYGMYNSPTKSLTSGKAFASMIDPNEAELPTPMAVSRNVAIHEENIGTAQKPAFRPFMDENTPAASRILNENQKTPASGFQTPGASKGLSTGKRTLSLKQALQPMHTFEENDDEDDEYEPVTPAPIRHAKPLGSITPFVDQPNASDKKQSAEKKPLFRPHEDEPGPQDEDDIFSIKPTTSTAFKPYQDSAPVRSSPPPGIFDEEDEDQWEGDQEEQPEDSDWQEEEAEAEEEYEEYPVEDGRWAPALTPITERTYEFTGNSKMWTTPLEVRDRSVMDTPFRAQEAFKEAERLAAELRAEDEREERSPDAEMGVENLQSSWEEIKQVEEEPIVDPYSKKIIAQLITKLSPPANHQDLRPQNFAHLEKLQKFINPKGRKSAPISSKKGGEDSYPLTLNGAKYSVHRKLGEGGFGAVFLADDLNLLEEDHEDSSAGSAQVAIKVVKPAIVWESFALDRVHQAVPESVRRSLISPRCLYVYQDESYHILDYSNHGTLLEAVNKAGELHVGSGLGGVTSSIPGMDEMLAMFFTVELLRTIEGLHSKGFIHGDMKIDNCMVRLDPCDSWSPQYDPSGGKGWSSKGVLLIDFGRVIDTSLFPPGTRFVTDWKMDKRDCLEMREGRPWTYETDYYGLAGIVYCLLYGKYMELPVVKDGIQKLSTSLKRYWKTAMWDRLFTALLNPNGFGKPLPIIDELASIRQEMETWLVENGNRSTRPSTLRALVKRLEALSV